MNNNLRQHFLLRDDITFLNFGSFGASPKPVFQAWQNYQLELEQEPVHFIVSKGMQYLKQSRQALAQYINCHEDDVVYVVNPSHAVNIVAKSFPLQVGDEVLSTNIEYGACDRTWQYYCNKAGAKYVRQPITLPIQNHDSFVVELFKGFNSKTKLIFISHITSANGLILPVELIIAKAKELGVPVFIDGAHCPGQLPLDITTLDPDFYTGACHKWMMTAKGSSFLYTKKAHQAMLDPLVVSWGYNSANPSHSQFLDYHQTQGTRDFTAFLTIPAAIDFMEEHSWSQVAVERQKLSFDNAARFCELLKTNLICPLHKDHLGQMISFPIKTSNTFALHDHLFENHKVQVPIMPQGDSVYLRYSVQGFNTQSDLDKLYDALADTIKNTSLIEL